jgi:LCP family protein required for cell wall assembly
MSTKGTLKEQYLAATTVLTQTIFDNFGIAPDRYITVPQSAFASLVDGLGGIEVEIPRDQDAYKHVLLEGRQVLNGQQALAYIRLVEKFGVGDLGRNSRQLPFIKAVLARMTEPANMIKIPGLISRLQDNIVTDLSTARIASLTCMLGHISPERIAGLSPLLGQIPKATVSYHTLPPDMTSPGPEASLVPEPEKVTMWLHELLKK